jgi:hypothetical protein
MQYISTNKIAIGLVRGGTKYALNPEKLRFTLNFFLPVLPSHQIT